ncbi:hypothetical protein N8467_00690 [bacterium]|nr:hypothetical protein [bacterium]
MKALFVVALSLLTSSVVAQVGIRSAKERYRSAGRALQNTNAEVERLIDLRIRHDLGLVDEIDDSLVRVDKPATPTDMATQRQELSKLTQETDYFRGEWEKLRTKVKLLNEAASAADDQARLESLIPSAGRALSGSPEAAKPAPQTPITMPAAPGLEVAPTRAANQVERADLGALALDPLRAQIHGSKDHLRVAEALYKVGQALVDRGHELREQGRVEAAKDLDARAKLRLDRAIKELEPLTSEQDASFAALFCLGRCRELLFRYSERHENLSLATNASKYAARRQAVREPFVQISARDVKEPEEATAVAELGDWGKAAKAAVEHFRWLNTNASYDASERINALTWPGERR